MQLTRWQILLLNPERLKGLVNFGYTQNQIAKMTGLSIVPLRQRIKEYKIKRYKKSNLFSKNVITMPDEPIETPVETPVEESIEPPTE